MRLSTPVKTKHIKEELWFVKWCHAAIPHTEEIQFCLTVQELNGVGTSASVSYDREKTVREVLGKRLSCQTHLFHSFSFRLD